MLRAQLLHARNRVDIRGGDCGHEDDGAREHIILAEGHTVHYPLLHLVIPPSGWEVLQFKSGGRYLVDIKRLKAIIHMLQSILKES